jgi:hypothetical protein
LYVHGPSVWEIAGAEAILALWIGASPADEESWFWGWVPRRLSAGEGLLRRCWIGLDRQSDSAGTWVDEDASLLGGNLDPVFSAGVAMRTNLFNYLVLQVDFDREYGCVWQFNFLSGF